MLGWLYRYWDERVSYDGGLSLVWMDGLLLIPFIMAAFFYPVQALLWAAGVIVLSFAGYEGYVLWKRRHHVKS